jgi:hypothetical protein
MLACCVKDGKDNDAAEFLGLYLGALDEELVKLRTYISTHEPPSAPSGEKLEEEAQSAEGQTEVGKRDYTVCKLFFISLHGSTLLMNAWTRIGKFSRFAHLAHIRWKVPFDRTCAKPARHCHYRSLAITPTQHPGMLPPPPAQTNLQTLRTAQFGTHHSRRTCTRFTAPAHAGRPIQLERGKPRGASRGASTYPRPPS